MSADDASQTAFVDFQDSEHRRSSGAPASTSTGRATPVQRLSATDSQKEAPHKRQHDWKAQDRPGDTANAKASASGGP